MAKELGVTSLPPVSSIFLAERNKKKEKDVSFHKYLTSWVQAWSLLFSCHHLVAMATAHRRSVCEEKEKYTGDNLDFIASLCEEVLADNFWSPKPKCPLINNMLCILFSLHKNNAKPLFKGSPLLQATANPTIIQQIFLKLDILVRQKSRRHCPACSVLWGKGLLGFGEGVG